MAKTAASNVFGGKAIKEIGNGFIKLVARIADQGAGGLLAHHALEMGDDGIFTIWTTAHPDWQGGISLAEDVVDDDVYCLIKKKGAEVLHNQKLATSLQIGTAVYKSAAGTWTVADKDTAASLLSELGIVCGPCDRITANVVKDIDDALLATEPVDICI